MFLVRSSNRGVGGRGVRVNRCVQIKMCSYEVKENSDHPPRIRVNWGLFSLIFENLDLTEIPTLIHLHGHFSFNRSAKDIYNARL